MLARRRCPPRPSPPISIQGVARLVAPSVLSLALVCACESKARRAPVQLGAARASTATPQRPATPISPASLTDAPHPQWVAYWHAGLAEVTRFALRQARYGDVHEDGHAVLVFVTEDFLPERQVKSEKPRAAAQVTPVLKLNALRRFTTGIYDYATMTSAFSPARLAVGGGVAAALKVTTSVQEWCGHVYLQLNRTEATGYRLRAHSYFEDEADEERVLPSALLEDELWNRVRLAPSKLPVGDGIPVVPSTLWSRLAHVPVAPSPANLRLGRVDAETLRYTVTYPALTRTLNIEFRAAFPHDILAFDETYADGFGAERGLRTTAARRTHLVRDAYWQHNRARDRDRRGSLGLPLR